MMDKHPLQKQPLALQIWQAFSFHQHSNSSPAYGILDKPINVNRGKKKGKATPLQA
jgi:hypothetical protein